MGDAVWHMLGDTVWYADIAEPEPIRGVVEYATPEYLEVRLASGSVHSSRRSAFRSTREEARLDGLARLDQMIARRRAIIAEAEMDISDLQRVRDAYAAC